MTAMSSSLVSFPTSESAPLCSPSPLVVTHFLPFRRISLPTAPPPIILPPQRRTKPVHRRRHAPPNEARDARRDKIITEFYDTEKSYFNGLDLVYHHFLAPILASLTTTNPLLNRQELTTLFSNFIDIWNFHRTFVTALTEHLQSKSTPLSAVLLAHFPYLSLYAPFITSFPASLTFLVSLSSVNTSPNLRFTTFLHTQESHPRCAHLRLSDYLLTPVQRCPRYLLLLKDLLQATDPASSEYEALQRTLGLVEKITTSLNTSLMTHAQTLSLLHLQCNTHNLPPSLSPLVAPGRDLLKRGRLICQESSSSVAYEFILLSDHLLWLSRDETSSTPGLRECRSNTRGENERWLYAGHIDLVDMEAVMTIVQNGVTPRLDILSPQGSFALYAPAVSATKQQETSEERDILDVWLISLREARAARLAALARVNPDSTLSASGSNVHIRQALRAFAYESTDSCGTPLASEHLATPRHSSDTSRLSPEEPRGNQFPQTAPKRNEKSARRAHVDHFLPPVWTPDAKADKCMRCGRPFGFVLDLRFGDVFGWRSTKVSVGGEANVKTERAKERGKGAWRRKHHCRICGRVVCAACSDKTFYISRIEANSLTTKEKPKPARACTECYDMTFPLLPGSAFPEPGPNVKREIKDKTGGAHAQLPTATVESERGLGGEVDPDAFAGVRELDSMTPGRPCAPVKETIRTNPQRFDNMQDHIPVSTRPIRIRSSARPRSYYDILDDFAIHHRSAGPEVGSRSGTGVDLSVGPSDADKCDNNSGAGSRPTNANTSMNASRMPKPRPRPKSSAVEEDPERRRKRFSLPAVALQTTPVFAHAIGGYRDTAGDGVSNAEVGNGGGDVRSGEDMLEGGLFSRRRDSSAMGMLVDVLKGTPMI
ncbi:hypothetical protein EDC04DRAFT_3116184 [Pisolithus marmoratus]|nr:hypothetical protein EDC04DRAFT_3116184 [Pisolithus marmoratus]